MKKQNIETKILWIVVVVLFLVVYTLISGMLTSTFSFNKDVMDPIASFSGALIGALISGLFATKVFERQIQHEIEKENADLENKLNVTKLFIVQRNRLLGVNANILINERLKKRITRTESDYENDISYFWDNHKKIIQFTTNIYEVKKDVFQYIYQKDIQAEELKLIGKLIDNIDKIINYYNLVIDKRSVSKQQLSWSITDLLNSIYDYEKFVDQLESGILRTNFTKV